MAYTVDTIKDKLNTDQRWLERGVFAIYSLQTSNEQRSAQSLNINGVGFNSPDAPYMDYIVKWLKKGGHLSGKFLDTTRKKMVKYSGQLCKIANGELS